MKRNAHPATRDSMPIITPEEIAEEISTSRANIHTLEQEIGQVFVDLGYAEKPSDTKITVGPELEVTQVAGMDSWSRRTTQMQAQMDESRGTFNLNSKNDSYMPERAQIKTLNGEFGKSAKLGREPSGDVLVELEPTFRSNLGTWTRLRQPASGPEQYQTPCAFSQIEFTSPPRAAVGAAAWLNAIMDRSVNAINQTDADGQRSYRLKALDFTACPHQETAPNSIHLNSVIRIQNAKEKKQEEKAAQEKQDIDTLTEEEKNKLLTYHRKKINCKNVLSAKEWSEWHKNWETIQNKDKAAPPKPDVNATTEGEPKQREENEKTEEIPPAPSEGTPSDLLLCIGQEHMEYLRHSLFMFARAESDYPRFKRDELSGPTFIAIPDRKKHGEFCTAMFRGEHRKTERTNSAYPDKEDKGPMRFELRVPCPGAAGHPNKTAYPAQEALAYEMMEAYLHMLYKGVLRWKERELARQHGEAVEPLTEKMLAPTEESETLPKTHEEALSAMQASEEARSYWGEKRLALITRLSEQLDAINLADRNPYQGEKGAHVNRYETLKKAAVSGAPPLCS